MAIRCPNNNHGPVQSFTDICLSCGHNIHESDEEYEASLNKELRQATQTERRSRIQEKEKLFTQLNQAARERDDSYDQQF